MEIGKQNGFTLIELMITVAVVAILAALAYPSFEGAMMKNRRAAAQAYLSDVAQKQQQYLMDARAYTNDSAVLKVVPPADVTRFYDLTITVAASTPPSFTATATPKAGGAQVKDGPLSITHNGTKLPAGKW
jgi:type IV pilus assembly protein PilE